MATAVGTVGSKRPSPTGTQVDESFMPSGAKRVSDGHGRYLDSILRGNCFSACNQAGVALSILSATATGFILTNPINSGIYAALLVIGWMQTTAAAAAVSSVQLAVGALSTTAVTHTTPIASGIVGHPFGSTSKGQCLVDSAATLPAAPTALMSLNNAAISATAAVNIPPMYYIDVSGLVVLLPGTTLSMSALTAATTVATHMFWEEIPIVTYA